MRKKVLLNLTTLLFAISFFAQSTGTFNGSVTNKAVTHTFVATGNGRYIFTGNYTNASSGWVTPVAFIGEYNNYNIGGNFETNGVMDFITDCVEAEQFISLRLDISGSHTYSITYQFVPTKYSSTDTEPNNTFNEAINTIENINYEGWFNNSSQNPTSNIDDTDWYKFISPRNGDLVITIKNGNELGGETSPSLFNSNDLSQEIFGAKIVKSGFTFTFTYDSFIFKNQEFGIRLQSNCNSYQMSWTVNDSNLSIDNYDLNNSIKLYPNPASNHFNIEIESPSILSEAVKVEVFDNLGRIAYQQVVNNQFATVLPRAAFAK